MQTGFFVHGTQSRRSDVFHSVATYYPKGCEFDTREVSIEFAFQAVDVLPEAACRRSVSVSAAVSPTTALQHEGRTGADFQFAELIQDE